VGLSHPIAVERVKHRSAPEGGFLVVEEVTDLTARAFYSRSEAVLYRSDDRRKRSLGAILGDPALLRLDQRGIVIQGWKPDAGEDGQQCQRFQIWLIKPLFDGPAKPGI
jgi:hypothetical protein